MSGIDVHKLAQTIADLPRDERDIVRALVSRMEQGRKTYGPWSVDDNRNYRREALLEVLDAMHYCAAELTRLARGVGPAHLGLRRVYVCHPFGSDPEGNARRIQGICWALAKTGLMPIAPQLYLPSFLSEETERERALELCLELIDICDEVRVYGGLVTEGMRIELERADRRGVPIIYCDEVQA